MESPKEKIVIVVAGGSGNRMKTEVPKQFLNIGKTPILVHTLFQFYSFDPQMAMILVLPSKEINSWYEIVKDQIKNNQFEDEFYLYLSKSVQVVDGGNTRFQSVKNGLNSIFQLDGIVCVHDGVRPFLSQSLIKSGFETASKLGNAVTVIAPKDSQRWIDNEGNSKNLDRNRVRIVQTPQVFDLKIIKEAYQSEELAFFTDDASVVEHAGHKINLIEGNYENIKITTPEDLIFAEIILSNK